MNDDTRLDLSDYPTSETRPKCYGRYAKGLRDLRNGKIWKVNCDSCPHVRECTHVREK